jgi:hypothetical protein
VAADPRIELCLMRLGQSEVAKVRWARPGLRPGRPPSEPASTPRQARMDQRPVRLMPPIRSLEPELRRGLRGGQQTADEILPRC